MGQGEVNLLLRLRYSFHKTSGPMLEANMAKGDEGVSPLLSSVDKA